MAASGKIGDRLIAAAQVAGVLATAWVVWINNVLPRLGLQSLGSIALEALFYVSLAWICGAVTIFWIYFVVSLADLPRATRLSLRASTPAMWFAPAIVLLSTPVAGAFAVSLFLVANATRQLISSWGVVESPIDRRTFAESALVFSGASADTAFLSWNSAPVLMGSLTAQAGLVAMLWRYPFRAAALFALSTAILTSLSIATGAYRPGKPPALPHSALSVVLTFLLAASLTFGGITVRRGGGKGSAASDSSDPGGQSAARRVKDTTAPAEASPGFGGDVPGVILLPELKPYPTIFVPVPAGTGNFRAPNATPVGIPFSGEYWLFRWPGLRPPRRSAIRRGSPSEVSFHTTDGWPMEMEAHQKLGTPVDVKCCSQIQLAVWSTDQYPHSASLELILVGAEPPNLPLSLGAVPVAASPPERVLSFPIPPATSLRRFDELKVVFHRAQWRGDKSARIAIERFVLVP